MNVEKECNDHIAALEQLMLEQFQQIDSSKSNSGVSLLEYCDEVMKLKEKDKQDIEDMKEKIKKLEKEHESNMEQLVLLEKQKEALRKEKEHAQEQKAMRKKHLNQLKKQRERIKQAIAEIVDLSEKDAESLKILERQKTELLLYKQLTGIAWDFLSPAHLVKGYVFNKEKQYVKSFCYDKEKMTSLQITEAIWENVLLSV